MTVSCCAVSSARRPASSALPGAATADVGASTPTPVATRAAPRASTARERRGSERWGRTVGLRSPAPGPGKGLVPNALKTDGREALSKSSGGRAGPTLRRFPLVTGVPVAASRHSGERPAAPPEPPCGRGGSWRGRRNRNAVSARTQDGVPTDSLPSWLSVPGPDSPPTAGQDAERSAHLIVGDGPGGKAARGALRSRSTPRGRRHREVADVWP